MKFTLTDAHIKLLRASYVSDALSEVEYGAAEIEGKRPYGNSDVEFDIAELLGIDMPEDRNGEKTILMRDAEYIRRLHAQTPTALQIVLVTGAFEPGVYEKTNAYDRRSWKKVG